MPAHITETIYDSTGTTPYSGPIRFCSSGLVKVVNSDIIAGEPVDWVVQDGELDVTLTEGTYLVRMRGTNDFYIQVPAGNGDYQLYELMTDNPSTPSVGAGIITTSPQDILPEDATVARLNIGAAGLSDVTGSPLIQSVLAARELTSEEVVTGTPVAFAPAASHTVTYLNLGNRYRALNGEKVSSFRLWMASTTPANCQVFMEAWRRSLDGRWHRVWASLDLRGTVTPANSTVTLNVFDQFSAVQNGDFFAVRITYTPGSVAPVLGDKSTPADPIYNNDGMSYARLDGDLADGADWTNAIRMAGRSICLQARNEYCPAVAILGFDQLLAWPESDSIYYPTEVFNRRLDLGWTLETFLGITVRNAARRNLLMSGIADIWNTDIVGVFPRVVVIHASARADIKAGRTKANWLSALGGTITSATNPAGNAGRAVVLSELPFSDASAANSIALNRTADEWTRYAQALTLTYGESKAAWLDVRDALGMERSGGDAGNVWALRPEFDSGNGMTLTRHGLTQLAISIGNGIKRYYRRLQATTPQVFAVRSEAGSLIEDADTTLSYVGSTVAYHSAATTLTANRVVTLPTVGVLLGSEIHVYRTAGGAFTLSIDGLTTLAQNQWCRVRRGTSAWVLVAKGTLT